MKLFSQQALDKPFPAHAYGQLFMRFGLEGAEAVHVGSVGEENRSLLMALFNGRVSVYDSGG